MATIRSDFLHKFNNLEGITIAERHKNFFKCLREIAPLLKDNKEDLDFISTNLKANSYLEDVLKVNFFIYFRRTSELLQLLKGGNSMVISKVAKQNWFFMEAFNSVVADELVNEILPCMSYSVRMKVLRKLSRYLSCEKFEPIFDALLTRYGIYLASQFITGCGPEKVRQILMEYHIRLTSTQLRILYDKDPELIDFYFIHSRDSFSDRRYNNLVKFIFHKNREYFDYLKQKYIIQIRLGRRASKKFIVVNKDAVIQEPHKFQYLDIRAVIRKLGKDSVKLFTNSLPIKPSTSLYEIGIINSFPYKYRYGLYFKAFQSHYNIKFEDHPELIDETLLKIIPENSERAILAKVKVDRGCDDYLKYLLVNDSIPLIKEKINLTSSIYERGKLIKYLVETCHINNDLIALYSVLRYFCFRHKNDELNVHLMFIQNIENIFGFEKFNEGMWASMNELLMIHMLKFDKSDATCQKIQSLPLLSFNLGISVYQKLSYLQFLFKRGEQIDDLLREYLTTNSEYPMCQKYEKNFKKYFLLFAINNISKQSDEQKDLDFNVNVISQIDIWNKCYKDDQLSLYDFPVLLYTFNYVIRDYKHPSGYHWPYKYPCLFREFHKKIFTTQQNSYRKEYLQIYWQQPRELITLKDIKWFLKYDPLVIVENFERVFNMLNISFPELDKKKSIWYIIKKYRHLQLDEKAVDKCLAKLSEDDPKVMKAKYIPCLSVVMKPSDYVVLADSYKPENKKLDLTNQKEVTLYQLQCAIATEFKNTKSYEVLWSLLNYCAGDYFKYAMPSLYSLLYRTPENMLAQYLNYLSTKAVSVRKHALFLTCELSTSAKVENTIKLLNQQEGVLSLQKHMFSATIQYFVKNPTDTIFELVKLSMLFIDKVDNESLNSITTHLSYIPQKYKTNYILHAWQHLEKTIEIWSTLAPLKQRLLVEVDEEIAKEIPLEWGLGVIQQHFITENDRDLSMNDFIFNFVTVREEKDAIFEKIFTVLNRCKVLRRVEEFLCSWYSKTMKARSADLKYLNPFVNYFDTKATPAENFCDYLKVFFLKIKVEYSQSLAIDELAVKVLNILEQVNLNFGPHITDIFAREVDSNLSYFVDKNSVTKLDIYYSMIKQRPVPLVAIFLSYVILKPYDVDSSLIFYKILRQMKSIDDVGVQVRLHNKFKKHLNEPLFLYL